MIPQLFWQTASSWNNCCGSVLVFLNPLAIGLYFASDSCFASSAHDIAASSNFILSAARQTMTFCFTIGDYSKFASSYIPVVWDWSYRVHLLDSQRLQFLWTNSRCIIAKGSCNTTQTNLDCWAQATFENRESSVLGSLAIAEYYLTCGADDHSSSSFVWIILLFKILIL